MDMWRRMHPEAAEPTGDMLANMARNLAELADATQRLARPQAPAYQVMGPYTFGGGSGTSTLANPYQTPAEYAILAITFTGAGTVALGPDAAVTSVAAQGSALAPGPQGYALTVSSAQAASIAPAPVWFPLSAGASLTSQAVLTSGQAYAVVAFRRALSPLGMPAEGHS